MVDTPERLCVDQHPTLGGKDDLQVLIFPCRCCRGLAPRVCSVTGQSQHVVANSDVQSLLQGSGEA